MTQFGPIGRLGRYTATHFRAVVDRLGARRRRPRASSPRRSSTALSGAGWEATGSQSVAARKVVDKNFGGLSSSALMVVVHSDTKTVADPAFKQAVAAATVDARRPTRA